MTASLETPIVQSAPALTFDDVLLIPAQSSIQPHETKTKARLSRRIELGVPLISAAMDTVTESRLAVAMAQAGGIGAIHKNMPVERQAAEVRKVKKFESGIVVDPVTITPDATLADAVALRKRHNISGIPVVDESTGRLVGIITNRDMRFAADLSMPVRDAMTTRLVTVKEGVEQRQALSLLHQHRIEKLPVVDDNFHCTGLMTVKDIEKASRHPHAAKDSRGRLRVAAAIGVGEAALRRAEALAEAGADALIIDTAHGHTPGVSRAVAAIRRISNNFDIIAGNVATADGASALIDAGADAVKVGIGPGSICTTRVIAGVGVPQLTAIMEVAGACRRGGATLVADGGVKHSGDIAKAVAAGADSVMIGSLLAGVAESPGEVFLYQGRSYKAYHGMGSLAAMARGSAERYQQNGEISRKLVPEGIEAQVPFSGPAAEVIHQLVGGLRAAMGYLGAADIPSFQKKARFRRMTQAGLQEAHVHGVMITRESPNYHPDA